MMSGKVIGSLSQVTKQLKQIYGDAPTPPFNSENYLDWVNTQLPSGILLEVDPTELEPFYLSHVRLVIDMSAVREEDEDRPLDFDVVVKNADMFEKSLKSQ